MALDISLLQGLEKMIVRRYCQSIRDARFALAFLVALSVLPVLGQSADFDLDREARRIFTLVMSPYCPGQMLADCTSSAAAELRDSIRAELARGRPSAEIVEELVATFGDQILALPPNRGAGRVAWLGPVLALLASLALLIWWMQQRRETQPTASAPPTSRPDAGQVDPALRRRLEEELKEFD